MSDEKPTETEANLTSLRLMLQHVYIPAMENRNDITHHMSKFIGHIKTSML
jgi:hypothetical protein